MDSKCIQKSAWNGNNNNNSNDSSQPSTSRPQQVLVQNPVSVSEQVVINRTPEELAHITKLIYSNDLIMSEVVKNVTGMKDRMNLELASSNLYCLSKSSGWAMTLKNQKTLRLTFTSPTGPAITIQLGSLLVRCPCLTVNSMRSIIKPGNDRMMLSLDKIAERFWKYVKFIEIGGTNEESLRQGVDKHVMVITKEILDKLNRFPKLESLTLRNCVFNSDALDFVTSPECTFKTIITSLTMEGIIVEREDDFDKITVLLDKNIVDLNMIGFKISTLGKRMLQKMENVDIRLNKVFLDLVEVPNVVEARSILQGFNSRSEKMELSFRNITGFRRHNLLHMARSCKIFRNLTALSINVKCMEVRDTVDFSEILEDLKYLGDLEYLKLGGWSDEGSIAFLLKGIVHCKKLKEFHWVNRAHYRNFGNVCELLYSLPSTIESLTFDGVPLTNEILSILIDRYRKTLKVFNITKPKKCFTSQSFKTIMRGFDKLEVFSLDSPIPSALLNDILEKETIEEANVVLANGFHPVLEVLLRDNFSSVRKIPLSVTPASVQLEMKNRKDTGTLRLPKEERFLERIEQKPAPPAPKKEKRKKLVW